MAVTILLAISLMDKSLPRQAGLVQQIRRCQRNCDRRSADRRRQHVADCELTGKHAGRRGTDCVPVRGLRSTPLDRYYAPAHELNDGRWGTQSRCESLEE